MVGWRIRRGEGLTLGAAGGLLGGQLGAIASLVAFGPGAGGQNVTYFIAGGLALALAVAPLGRFAASLMGALAGQALVAFLNSADVVDQVVDSRGPEILASSGVGLGLAAAVAVGLASRRTPARGMRWSPLGLVCGLVTGVLIGGAAWVRVGPAGGLLVGLVGVVTCGYTGGLLFDVAPADPRKAATPRTVLARDRAAFRSGACGPGIAVGLSTGITFAIFPSPIDGLPYGLRVGLGVGLTSLIVIGLVAGFIQASWGSFTVARWWLATSRRLPWRLMTFLADAHTNRGVLRQAGAVYQFRHAELQRRLASDQRH
jgi:hypothetical protein